MKSSAEEAQWRGDDYPEPHMAGARSESVGSEWETEPLFAPTKRANAAIAIVLVLACMVVGWLLADEARPLIVAWINK